MRWNRALGTSKREQEIVTPKAPQNQRTRLVLKLSVPIERQVSMQDMRESLMLDTAIRKI